MRSEMNDAKGYTLVEIMMAVAISLVLLGAIYAAVNSVQRSSAGLERKVTAQQDVRPALELMAMEIRMASFNPNFASGIWKSDADCASAPVSQSYRGIQTATANSISVEMDIDGSSAVGDHSNEIITYSYDAANQYITRETNCTGGGQPFLGDTAASGRPRTVMVVNDPATTPLFRYYDGGLNPIAAADLPARIPDIRTIEITLVAQTAEIDPVTGLNRTLIYSTTVIPRNHAPMQ
jgi:prepilin-type N-terminal cleavage/methylation domain-containing protein